MFSNTSGKRPGPYTPKAIPRPKSGSAATPTTSSTAKHATQQRTSAAPQPGPGWAATNAPAPTHAPPTSPTNTATSNTPKPSNKAGPSPPASSKAPAATSSKTAWTSPAPAGDSPAPKPSSNYEPYTATVIGTNTGPTTSTKNSTESTKPATPTTSSRERHDVTPKEPHPSAIEPLPRPACRDDLALRSPPE